MEVLPPFFPKRISFSFYSFYGKTYWTKFFEISLWKSISNGLLTDPSAFSSPSLSVKSVKVGGSMKYVSVVPPCYIPPRFGPIFPISSCSLPYEVEEPCGSKSFVVWTSFSSSSRLCHVRELGQEDSVRKLRALS